MLFDGMPVADAGAADQNKSSKNIKKIDIGVVSVDLPTYVGAHTNIGSMEINVIYKKGTHTKTLPWGIKKILTTEFSNMNVIRKKVSYLKVYVFL